MAREEVSQSYLWGSLKLQTVPDLVNSKMHWWPGPLFKQRKKNINSIKLLFYFWKNISEIDALELVLISCAWSTLVSINSSTALSCRPGPGCPLSCPHWRRWSLQVWKTRTQSLCSIFCQLDEVRRQKCARGEHRTAREGQNVKSTASTKLALRGTAV